MNGFEIFLPFKAYAEYRTLTAEAVKAQDFTTWIAFVQKHRIVVSWECKDRDGNALDPAKKEDFDKLSIGAISQLIEAVNHHINGAQVAAKN